MLLYDYNGTFGCPKVLLYEYNGAFGCPKVLLYDYNGAFECSKQSPHLCKSALGGTNVGYSGTLMQRCAAIELRLATS